MNTTTAPRSILDGIPGLGGGPEKVKPLPVATPEDPQAPAHTQHPLVRGSVAAQALYHVISGERVIIIDAPPGGGKTGAVSTIAAHLANRYGKDLPNLSIATPTRAQGASMYGRLTEQMHPAQVTLAIKNADVPERPAGALDPKEVAALGRGTVSLRTLASLKLSVTKPGKSDRLLLVDEAYQATFSDVAAAASGFSQLVLVGDPGQIGPVVPVDTGAWDALKRAPHRRAPEAFATMPFVTRLHMDKSYRLGAASVAAIAPLYDFQFTTARPARTLGGLPEIGAVQHTDPTDSCDPALLRTVAQSAARLVGSTQSSTERDGTMSTKVLGQGDVAVVVALNAQVSMVTGMLHSMGLEHVTVGTADRLQGGEWAGVVALDPLAGGSASEHHLALGRLCVMASRHTTHLTWVHDGAWDEALDGMDATKAVATSRTVRRALTATPLGT